MCLRIQEGRQSALSWIKRGHSQFQIRPSGGYPDDVLAPTFGPRLRCERSGPPIADATCQSSAPMTASTRFVERSHGGRLQYRDTGCTQLAFTLFTELCGRAKKHGQGGHYRADLNGNSKIFFLLI